MGVSVSYTSSAFSTSAVAATLPHLVRAVRDNVTDGTPLLSFLMGKLGGEQRKVAGMVSNTGDGLPGVIVGGRDIQVPVQLTENATVQSFSGADPLDISHQDNDNYAIFPIRQIAGSLVIIGRDMRACKGEAQIYSLMESKVSRLIADMRMQANTQAVSDGTGNGGKDIIGLTAIVSNSTLAGISPTTYPKWQPGGFASTASRYGIISSVTFSSTGLDNMRSISNRVTFGTDGPDAIFASRTVAESYEDLLEANIQYTTLEVGDGSFKTLAYKGIRLFFDHALPTASASGSMYFLNSRHIAFIRDSASDFVWIDEGQRPANQDVFTKIMIVEGNIVTDNRRMLGAITSIT